MQIVSVCSGDKVQVSVARHLQAPPYAAKRKDLSFGYPNCLRSKSDRSTVVVGNCTCGPITVVPHRAKAGLFRRSSILFRPHARATPRGLVEPPGTAPGSEPLITGAFIAIVRVAPNKRNIGRPAPPLKPRRPLFHPGENIQGGEGAKPPFCPDRLIPDPAPGRESGPSDRRARDAPPDAARPATGGPKPANAA